MIQNSVVADHSRSTTESIATPEHSEPSVAIKTFMTVPLKGCLFNLVGHCALSGYFHQPFCLERLVEVSTLRAIPSLTSVIFRLCPSVKGMIAFLTHKIAGFLGAYEKPALGLPCHSST